MTNTKSTLLATVEKKLADAGTGPASLQEILSTVVRHFDCVVGTLHGVDAATGHLALKVQQGLPPVVVEKIQIIPVGKGMAGIAAFCREAVQVCNLQTDASGVVKPGAKDARVEGAATAPSLVDGKLRGTLGVAKAVAYEFSAAELAELTAVANLIGSHLPA